MFKMECLSLFSLISQAYASNRTHIREGRKICCYFCCFHLLMGHKKLTITRSHVHTHTHSIFDDIDEIYVAAKNQLVAIKLIIFDSNWHIFAIGFASHTSHISR